MRRLLATPVPPPRQATVAAPAPAAPAAHPPIEQIRSKYTDLLSIRAEYQGEDLSPEDVPLYNDAVDEYNALVIDHNLRAGPDDQLPQKARLAPKRHARESRQIILRKMAQRRKQQDEIARQLRLMAFRGEGASQAYVEALKDMAELKRQEDELAAKLAQAALEGPAEQLESYKVRYLRTEEQREPYRLSMRRDDGGRPLYLVQGGSDTPFSTSDFYSYGGGSGWAAFAMDPDGNIYAGEHRIQRFHHSSFLAGGRAAASGEIKVERGQLKAVSNKTGHYHAEAIHLANLLREFDEMGADLGAVEVYIVPPTGGKPVKLEAKAEEWLVRFSSQAQKKQAARGRMGRQGVAG
jgi:hypothetical protein